MHLDTVFTQIDKDKFSIFSNYKFDIFKLVKNGDNIDITSMTTGIGDVVSEVFGVKAQLIHCGNGDPLISEREQ